ncbi:MAG TPA: GtrA family protein [Allosphingosinicella sp.]
MPAVGVSAQAETARTNPNGFVPRVMRLFESIVRRVLGALDRLDYPWLRPWLRLARNREFWRFIRFLATGSLNFVFYYSIFTVLHLFHFAPVTAVICATVLGVLFNFCTTGRFVFGSGRLYLLPRFIGVYIVQCAANIAMLRGLIALDVPVLAAEALVIGLLAIATYFALRRFVFSPALIARNG